MQYAYMKIRGTTRVLDACELPILDKAADGEGMNCAAPSESETDASPLSLVYGAFLPNQDLLSTPTEACDFLREIGGYALQVFTPSGVSYSGLTGIFVGKPIHTAKSWRVPFAALVASDMEFATDKRQFGKTACLYYSNLSPAENILNRKGVLSLKTKEARFPGRINEKNWREFVDETRMMDTATAV